MSETIDLYAELKRKIDEAKKSSTVEPVTLKTDFIDATIPIALSKDVESKVDSLDSDLKAGITETDSKVQEIEELQHKMKLLEKDIIADESYGIDVSDMRKEYRNLQRQLHKIGDEKSKKSFSTMKVSLNEEKNNDLVKEVKDESLLDCNIENSAYDDIVSDMSALLLKVQHMIEKVDAKEDAKDICNLTEIQSSLEQVYAKALLLRLYNNK